jgi:hypothetical protein
MVAIVCPMLAALLSAMAADAPIVLDPRKQLFLDDYLIASMTRVRRTVEQARKFSGNPVLWPTEHWEPPMAIVYGSVIRDGAKFKMWYKSGIGVAYAESEDGIQWSKPLSTSHSSVESARTFCSPRRTYSTDPEAFPPRTVRYAPRRPRSGLRARRYKMGFLDIDWKYDGPDGLPWRKGQRRGFAVAGSPDGIHWKLIDSWATSAIVDGAPPRFDHA